MHRLQPLVFSIVGLLSLCFLCQPAWAQGTVSAWGDNHYGQLGNGTYFPPLAATGTVSGLTDVTAIARGEFHSLALKSDGTVWAWGDNENGALGNGTTTNSTTPVQVSGLTGVTAIAGGYFHSLALKSDGTVWAWGLNIFGQSTSTITNTPVQVSGLTGVTVIAGAGYHSLALRGDGTVWAWGQDVYGVFATTFPPVQVLASSTLTALTGVTAVTGGAFHSLALKSDGTVWAWGGSFSGQLGNGTNTTTFAAVQVSGLTSATAIAAGDSYSLALKSDGTVWAWGENGQGQLGNGTNTSTNTPVQVSGLTGVTAIAAGWDFSLALKSDGTVRAWGYNGQGQLGNGTSTDTNTAVQVSGLTGVTAIAAGAGSFHSLALIALPPDTSAPVIVPTITGTLGLNNWYVSNVGVSWSVTDPESGIASSSGCGPVTLSTNTPGTPLTCSTTNGAGLANSVSVFVKIDKSPPNPPTAVLNPAANGAGWNNSSATVSFMSGGDVGPSGVATCAAPIVLSSETAGTVLSGGCTDLAGNGSAATFVIVKIDETAPAASNVVTNLDPVPINNGITLTATIADPGTVVSGVASAQYNINGGPFSGMSGTFNQPSVNVTAAAPAFTSTGVYTLCVKGTDVAGNSSSTTCIPLPVYDPTGGFVTGGGSISSPIGADLANSGASGPATFGFVSKYLPGRNVPSGDLEFHFKEGSLDFKSTSMDWLVVTGEPRAKLHGSGSINGGTVCQFEVDAWSKSFQPGNADAFGLKISSCDNGSDRYNVPAVPLTRGSVIIHP